MRVNGKKVPVYQLDTDESLLLRIASMLDTLPKYLQLSNPLDREGDNKVGDILKDIRKDAEKNLDYNAFIRGKGDESLSKELLPIWLAYNRELEAFKDFLLLPTGQKLVEEGYYPTIEDFNYAYNNSTVKKDLERAIDREKKQNTRNIELYETFEEIDEGWVSTSIRPERTELKVTLDVSGVSDLELFNYITLSEVTPFATCRDFHKIFKNFIPPVEWLNMEERVGIRVNEKSSGEKAEYADVKVSTWEESGEETYLTTRLVTERGYLSR